MTSLEYMALFPEFTTISDDTKNAFISLAGCIDTSLFCMDSAYIIALYAGHLLSMTCTKLSSSGGGQITSIKEGGLSISYAQNVQGASYYNLTPYGRTLIGLMKSSFVSMDVIV